MALGIDADLNANNWANYDKAGGYPDFSAYGHDWIYIWVYAATLDHLDAGACCIRYFIGSDVANYLSFDTTKAELSVGWNLLKFDLDNPDGSLGDIDWTAINWERISILETDPNVTDFTVYFDSFMFVRPFSGATDGITEGATVQYLIE
jgi:hypothetical protein